MKVPYSIADSKNKEKNLMKMNITIALDRFVIHICLITKTNRKFQCDTEKMEVLCLDS